MNALLVEFDESTLGNIVPIRPNVKVVVQCEGDVLGGVVHACKAWGRTQVWMQTNEDRYGNQDGWPQSIASRLDQAIEAGGVYGSREREAMRGDALAVSVACRGMPELAYCVLWMQYVMVKARQYHRKTLPDGLDHLGRPKTRVVYEFGDWYKMPVKTKARDLGIGTNDYYKHLNGAHMWLAGRLETVRTK